MNPNLFFTKLVYKYLVCEFNHWDCCLTGLVKIEDQYFYCRFVGDVQDIDGMAGLYTLTKIEMNDKVKEYIDDYAEAYPHWFKDERKKPSGEAVNVGVFKDKWKEQPFKFGEELTHEGYYQLTEED